MNTKVDFNIIIDKTILHQLEWGQSRGIAMYYKAAQTIQQMKIILNFRVVIMQKACQLLRTVIVCKHHGHVLWLELPVMVVTLVMDDFF